MTGVLIYTEADEIVPPWLATKPKNRIIFKAFALFWAEAFLHI